MTSFWNSAIYCYVACALMTGQLVSRFDTVCYCTVIKLNILFKYFIKIKMIKPAKVPWPFYAI